MYVRRMEKFVFSHNLTHEWDHGLGETQSPPRCSSKACD